MRPRSLEEVAGQQHILAPGKLLRRAIESDRFTSLIFYGPPGTGKTTLASVIARTTGSRFESLNGVESNVAEIRAKIDQARTWRDLRGETTILFIDEIHRFNKAQQDVLLPHIERGVVRFIGATTHNPYFHVNSPLVSRSQIFQLEPVPVEDVIGVLERALADEERGLGEYAVVADPEALRHLSEKSDGDVRKALSALELAVLTTPDEDGVVRLTLAVAEESIQRKAVVYDAHGDAHHDTISAFIKSIRGSDPDAALYWLAKMLHAGEDPRFISRRLVISASEDIGLADSNALRVALDAHAGIRIHRHARGPDSAGACHGLSGDRAEIQHRLRRARQGDGGCGKRPDARRAGRTCGRTPARNSPRRPASPRRRCSIFTPTITRALTCRRRICRRGKFTISPATRAWKNASRSVWISGGARWGECGKPHISVTDAASFPLARFMRRAYRRLHEIPRRLPACQRSALFFL